MAEFRCECLSPVLNGTKLSPVGVISRSPGQASAQPWVLGRARLCPEGAASRWVVNLAPFSPLFILLLFPHLPGVVVQPSSGDLKCMLPGDAG